MLTEHKILEGKMPTAWTEPAHRELDGEGFEETRFRLVCDEVTGPLAAVSDKYALVPMRDVISALDLAADAHSIELEPIEASYKSGRGEYKFRAPGLAFQAPGDPSITQATISIGNDYRGMANLSGMAGWFRWVCKNGLYAGTMAGQVKRRHVGTVDVYGLVGGLVAGLRDTFEVQRILAETLARTHYVAPRLIPTVEEAKEQVKGSDAPTLIAQIMADTAERYEQYFRTAVHENQREMGTNLWALAQAVSETSTHRMPGFTADEWATRQLNRIRKHARS